MQKKLFLYIIFPAKKTIQFVPVVTHLHVGECSFIGQRHYTGLSGEIHGRYGYGTDAYPRENCIAPDTCTLYSTTYTCTRMNERGGESELGGWDLGG